MLKPELLSPAGNLNKLKIALAYGADAVYASVGAFSLRARSAREFTPESFAEGVRTAHAMGRKFYATINAFPFNGQIENIKRHLGFLNELGVDALIIATPGVMALARELCPNVQIHLSTQANVMNYLDAQIYAQLGASRIVLAREISLKDAVQIKEKLPHLELEIFAHGSMCFAYSGRCLVSALQSGRFSNRGACANDCRFGYEIYAKSPENGALFRIEESEQGTNIMNAKDLCMASHVEQIVRSGVIDSLKIEGRTKSEYYVACATRVYRQAIDDAVSGAFAPEIYAAEIATLKNRGFTDGYLIKRPYERDDTQNLDSSLEAGTHQVVAFAADGDMALAKGTITREKEYEIFAPLGEKIEICDNEIGQIYEKFGKFWLKFAQIKTSGGKCYEQIHSGNENAVVLPARLPKFSFLREKI